MTMSIRRACALLTILPLALIVAALSASPASAGPCALPAPVISAPSSPVAPATTTLIAGTIPVQATYGGLAAPDSAVLRLLPSGSATALETPLQALDNGSGPYPIFGVRDTRPLADGEYTLSVVVSSGGCETSSGLPVTVDNTAPTLTVGSGPADGASLAAGASASFGFSASDVNGPVTFTCAYEAATPAACTSPTAAASLAAGAHTFRVIARDAAGNTAVATRSFTVALPATPPPPETGNDQPKAKPRCHVPQLRGLTLARARARLTKAHCRLGRVRRPPARILALPFNRGQRLVVQRQTERRGAYRANGQPVGIALVPKRDLKLS